MPVTKGIDNQGPEMTDLHTHVPILPLAHILPVGMLVLVMGMSDIYYNPPT